MEQPSIAFIGGGNMARSMIGGLIADGFPAHKVAAADPSAGALESLGAQHGIRTSDDNAAIAADADVLVLAVKPQYLRAAAASVAAVSQARSPLIISVAAGIRERDIRGWLGGTPAIVRVMPNTPALLGCGASALFANAAVSDRQRDVAESVLRAVGTTIWIDDESLMDAVTAVSGSGPAYFFLLMETIEKTARELGLPPDAARLLTTQTALGAARMALESSETVATLRERVTSPGGTTAAALSELDARGFRDIVQAAVTAAQKRSAELADEFGGD